LAAAASLFKTKVGVDGKVGIVERRKPLFTLLQELIDNDARFMGLMVHSIFLLIYPMSF
jgi:hypothetical protein